MTQRTISFGGFRFDAATGELTGPDKIIRLGPQPARLLRLLVERPGVLHTRDQLKRAMWPDTVVEADQGLNFCVLQLRTALGDEAGEARFIETLPRRGYRFIAKIDSDALPDVEPRPARALPRSLLFTFAAVCVLAAAWAVASAVRGVNKNLAIMPVTARAGDPAWIEQIGADVSDRLITKLTAAAPGKIGVVGPLTTQRFANDPRSASQIGQALNVGYVLSASVRASDSTLFVQVVRVPDGVHVCAFRRRVWGVNLDSLIAPLSTAIADGILNDDSGHTEKFNCGR
ncbi:MAG: winged helix-turn-helix domain-containing protein [Gemmatimonas sp.]